MNWSAVKNWGFSPVDGAPLVALRLVFAALVLFSTVRFAAYGWIETQIVDPQITFPFWVFASVPRPGWWAAWGLFAAMAAGSVLMLADRPRLGAVVFFVPFTFVELLDKTNYLNHYYFVSLMALLLAFLPSQRRHAAGVPRFARDLPKVLLTLVYFYAGIAKLHPEWIWDGMPLRIWLPQHNDFPVIGPLLALPETAVLFSWGGLLFDLTAGFLLWSNRWRPWVYPVVVAFHVMTWCLFPIGVFPWVMIGCTTVFFSADFHRGWVQVVTRKALPVFRPEGYRWPASNRGLIAALVFLCVQLVLPWRYLAYPGELFWHEAGYRFSWRVMLIEKAGAAFFYARDDQGREREVDLSGFLTPNQIKMMATQPDLLVQTAQWIERRDAEDGLGTEAVRAEVWVTLNGRRSQLFIDPFVDLTEVEDGPGQARYWVLPLDSVVTMSEYRRMKPELREQAGW